VYVCVCVCVCVCASPLVGKDSHGEQGQSADGVGFLAVSPLRRQIGQTHRSAVGLHTLPVLTCNTKDTGYRPTLTVGFYSLTSLMIVSMFRCLVLSLFCAFMLNFLDLEKKYVFLNLNGKNPGLITVNKINVCVW